VVAEEYATNPLILKARRLIYNKLNQRRKKYAKSLELRFNTSLGKSKNNECEDPF